MCVSVWRLFVPFGSLVQLAEDSDSKPTEHVFRLLYRRFHFSANWMWWVSFWAEWVALIRIVCEWRAVRRLWYPNAVNWMHFHQIAPILVECGDLSPVCHLLHPTPIDSIAWLNWEPTAATLPWYLVHDEMNSLNWSRFHHRPNC